MSVRYHELRPRSIVALLVGVLLFSGCASEADTDLQSSPGVDEAPPQSNIEILAGGSSEWLAATAEYNACMKEMGWDYRESDAGTVFGFPVGQEDAFHQSDRDCNDRSGRSDLSVERVITQDEYQRGYESMLELRTCLSEYGIETPAAPTLQSFVESGGQWSPYLFVQEDAIDDALEVCPQPVP